MHKWMMTSKKLKDISKKKENGAEWQLATMIISTVQTRTFLSSLIFLRGD